MDVEKIVKILNRARQATSDPNLHDVFKVLVEMVHELSIAEGKIGLLEMRVEELEGGRE